MRRVGLMWILEDDEFFASRFEKTGDKFDYEYLEYSMALTSQKRIALDIGGHYGSWARPLGLAFERVISFEPRTDLYECLCLNTQDYPTIEPLNLAIGSEAGSVSIATPAHILEKVMDGNSGLATVSGAGDIAMITIDSMGLTGVDFIKVDVEGFELFALQGAEETIKRDKPVIIFEENGRCFDHNVQRGDVGKYLSALGMKKHKVFPGENHVYVW